MKFQKKNGQALGIDIGSTNTKIVCVQKGDQGYEVLAHGLVKRGSPEASELLKRYTGASVRVSIEDPSLKIRRVDIPPMPEREIPEAVKYGFKSAVGLPIEDYIFRHRRLPVTVEEKIPMMVYALKHEALAQALAQIRGFHLKKVDIVEPEAAALLMLFNFHMKTSEYEPTALIDLGAGRSLFTVVSHGELLFSRHLAGVSGDQLTAQISRDLGVDNEKAEDMKITRGEGRLEALATRLDNTLSIYFSSTALEIQRSIDAFCLQFGIDKITHIYLLGGGAYMANLPQKLTTTLGVPTDILDPFARMNCDFVTSEEFQHHKLHFGVACGLAVDDYATH